MINQIETIIIKNKMLLFAIAIRNKFIFAFEKNFFPNMPPIFENFQHLDFTKRYSIFQSRRTLKLKLTALFQQKLCSFIFLFISLARKKRQKW